jgi:hypothetical protein
MVGLRVAWSSTALLPATQRLWSRRRSPVFDDAVAVLAKSGARRSTKATRTDGAGAPEARELTRGSAASRRRWRGTGDPRGSPRPAAGNEAPHLYAAASDQIDLTVRTVRGWLRAAFDVVRAAGPRPGRAVGAFWTSRGLVEALAAYLERPGRPKKMSGFGSTAARRPPRCSRAQGPGDQAGSSAAGRGPPQRTIWELPA